MDRYVYVVENRAIGAKVYCVDFKVASKAKEWFERNFPGFEFTISQEIIWMVWPN